MAKTRFFPSWMGLSGPPTLDSGRVRTAEKTPDFGLVMFSALMGFHAYGHGVDMAVHKGHAVNEILAGGAVIAARVVKRDTSFINPEDVGSIPGDAGLKRLLRQYPVHASWG